MEALLLATDITKSYGGTDALRSVQFGLFTSEVHALIGENGAGKSTLARILAGSVRADTGDIFVDGQRSSITQTMDAQRLGIGIIYQELDLFPHLTVGENIVIGNLGYAERGFVSRRQIERFFRPFLQQVGLYIDSHRWVASLSIAQQPNSSNG